MNPDTLFLLRSCERVGVVAVPGGYAVFVECRGESVPLTESGSLLLYSDPVYAAESIKHAVRSGVPISLPLEFFGF